MKVYFRKPVKQIPVASGIYFQDELSSETKTEPLWRGIEYRIYDTVCDLKRLSRQVKQIPDHGFRSFIYAQIKDALINIRRAWKHLGKDFYSCRLQVMRATIKTKDARLKFVIQFSGNYYVAAKKEERRKAKRSEVNTKNAKLIRKPAVTKDQIIIFMDHFEYQNGTYRGGKTAACLEFGIDLKTLNRRLRE